ncbi:MAG: hypothetical protein V1815_03100 [Candidatus Woesearchaeota archaeon]
MKFINGFLRGQKKFGENISIVINSILLTIVYFIGIGLTSIFAKIFNKHFLDLKLRKNEKTYWEDLNLTKKSMKEYYRQF